ncbi:MAG: DUF4019 domain-containing protein [Candidatus Cloacimonetes bacterium]|nr:DUF4019 domain-containing protein [Candidatus Cloacimonadota bacterium]
MKTKLGLILLVALLFIACVPKEAAETQAVEDDSQAVTEHPRAVADSLTAEESVAALAAAENWLKFVDNKQWDESWENAAVIIQNHVPKEQWSSKMVEAFTPFGDCVSREFLTSVYKTELPGAPFGKYLIIRYRCEYSSKANVIETVTPMFESGEWKVSGYYIR